MMVNVFPGATPAPLPERVSVAPARLTAPFTCNAPNVAGPLMASLYAAAAASVRLPVVPLAGAIEPPLIATVPIVALFEMMTLPLACVKFAGSVPPPIVVVPLRCEYEPA